MPKGAGKRKGRHLWTAEEDALLTAVYTETGVSKAQAALKEKFGIELTQSAVFNRVHKLGIKTKHPNEWCKGKRNQNRLPVGTEVDNKARKAILVKTSDTLSSNRYDTWKYKTRVVWENAHGKIPDNYVVIQIDGDYHNCELSNLRCLPKMHTMMLYERGWLPNTPEIVDAGIEWCKLHYALREAEGYKHGTRKHKYRRKKGQAD